LQGLASQPGDVKVAFIWGAGGTGKSALANRLCTLLHRAPMFIEKYQRHQRSPFFSILFVAAQFLLAGILQSK
jgi:deoxyadenosine/deoxycytidine kinase